MARGDTREVFPTQQFPADALEAEASQPSSSIGTGARSTSRASSKTSSSGAGTAGDSDPAGRTGSDRLPGYDNNKTYLVRGASLNAIVEAIRRNRIDVIKGGGLKKVLEGANGTYLAAVSTIDLTVCINGSPVTKTFLLAK